MMQYKGPLIVVRQIPPQQSRKGPRRGLVYGMRYDGSWYGPAGETHAEARRLARWPIGKRQRSGAVLYAAPGTDRDRVAVWIPRDGLYIVDVQDVDRWLDPPDG
jgi:hypothetical protein